MSVRRVLALVLSIPTISFLSACGGGGSVTRATPPPTGGFSNSNLSGTYVFSVSGTDGGNSAFAMVGTFNADGSGGNGQGNITGGTIDINDEGFATANPVILPATNAAISSSSHYTVGVDGRGQATIVTSTAFGTITLDFVLQDKSHGLVTEFDGNSGSGTIDLQTAGVSSLSGSYAFSLAGTDASGNPLASVGGFTLGSGSTAISAGGADFNDANIVQANQSISGNVTVGPATTPTTTLVTTALGTLTFDVYAIDATHIKLIETDSSTMLLSGDAFSQTSIAVSGTLAFTMAGAFPFSTAPNNIAVGGFMVTDGAGNITSASSEDINNGGLPSSIASFTGTYSATGSVFPGRLNFALTNFFGGVQFAAYPFDGGIFLLEVDPGNAGIVFGTAYPQTTTTFNTAQGYGLNLSGVNLSNGVEVDDIAEFAANSSGTTAIGIIDESYNGANPPLFDLALNGTYVAPDANGRGALSANAGNSSVSTLNGGFNLTFYAIDGTSFPFVETDSGQVSSGVFIQQSSASSSAVQSHIMMTPRLIRSRALRQRKK